MTRLRTLLLVLAGALLASSCIGSLQQVFRDKDVVEMKKIGGLWTVTRYGDAEGLEIPKRPWVFQAAEPFGVKGYLVDMQDDNERNATLHAVFFRVGKELYVETSVQANPRNELAALHELPVRIPSRVELSKGEMRVFPLNPDVVKAEGAALGRRELDGFVTLDVDADKWHAFLTKHGAKAFADKPLIVLQREGK